MSYNEGFGTDMPDFDENGGYDIGRDSESRQTIPELPKYRRHEMIVAEGCICLALLSLATTTISLMMLKSK